MKKPFHHPQWERLMMSLTIPGMFILIVMGSPELSSPGVNMGVIKEDLGNGEFKETERHQFYEQVKTISGKQSG